MKKYLLLAVGILIAFLFTYDFKLDKSKNNFVPINEVKIENKTQKDLPLGLAFELPKEFQFMRYEGERGTQYEISYKEGIENLIGFQGHIKFYNNFTDYHSGNLFDGGKGFFYDLKNKKWRYINRDGEQDLNKFTTGKTFSGENIFQFYIVDAGGTYSIYAIPLWNKNNQPLGVLEISWGTDESPQVDGTYLGNKEERSGQREELKLAFLKLSRSVTLTK